MGIGAAFCWAVGISLVLSFLRPSQGGSQAGLGEARGRMGERAEGPGQAHGRGEHTVCVCVCMWAHCSSKTRRGGSLLSHPVHGSKQVLTEREQQIQQKMEQNRQAQQDSVRFREQLIQQLEEARQLTQREQEVAVERKTARKQELQAQVRIPCQAGVRLGC